MSDNSEIAARLMAQFAIAGFKDTMNNLSRPDNNVRQVLAGMECLASNMKPKKLRKGTYYRARVIETKDISDTKGFSVNDNGGVYSGFNEIESGRAPECLVKAGRLNREWESLLYLTNDAYTAMAEVRPSVREQISVAKYRVGDNADVRVLDFADDKVKMQGGFEKKETALENYDLNEIYVLMQEILTLPAYNERTYFISNIIADRIKKADVSGIIYKSFYGKGNNIALWNTDEKAVEYCGSKVFLYYCSNQAFANLEDGKIIKNTVLFNRQIKEGCSEAVFEAQKMYKKLINKSRR